MERCGGVDGILVVGHGRGVQVVAGANQLVFEERDATLVLAGAGEGRRDGVVGAEAAVGAEADRAPAEIVEEDGSAVGSE